MKVTLDGQLRRCADNRSVWLDLLSSHATPHISNHNSLSSETPAVSVPGTTNFTAAASALPNPQNPSDNGPMPTMTFNCIADSLIWVSRGRDSRLLNEDSTGVSIQGLPECMKSTSHVQVLCTGSLHLVGGILSLLDPFICDK